MERLRFSEAGLPDEALHPDVLYFPNGFGPQKFTWLMTVTPFPGMDESRENPELLVSMDGQKWRVPTGAPSPVVGPPEGWQGYNSDPCLFEEDGELSLIYRRVKELEGGWRIELLRLITRDCVSWAGHGVFMARECSGAGPGCLMSPSLLKEAEEYLMWTVLRFEGKFTVFRQASRDLQRWSEPEAVVFENAPELMKPWHLHVAAVPGKGRLVMSLCALEGSVRGLKVIYFAESADSGRSWKFTGSSIYPSAVFKGCDDLYRSSLVLPPEGERCRLFLSARDAGGEWGIYSAEIERREVFGRPPQSVIADYSFFH